MLDVIVWGLIGGLLGGTIAADWRAGSMVLPRSGGGPRRNRQPLRRSEYPLLFATLLGLKVFAAIFVGLALTGRLLPLLQWGL